MEYTKGEWKVEDTFRVIDECNKGIAHSLKPNLEEAKANTHLIAAAPDMYEALRGILLVATPLGNAEMIFEKLYPGVYRVLGNRLEIGRAHV